MDCFVNSLVIRCVLTDVFGGGGLLLRSNRAMVWPNFVMSNFISPLMQYFFFLKQRVSAYFFLSYSNVNVYRNSEYRYIGVLAYA